jgi:hypothetical protein
MLLREAQRVEKLSRLDVMEMQARAVPAESNEMPQSS